MATIHELKPNRPPLSINGVGRDFDIETAVVVYFSRRLTDDELRFFQDVCKRTAHIMEHAVKE